jgi:C_GCAxxG_C_C family probable redox protein
MIVRNPTAEDGPRAAVAEVRARFLAAGQPYGCAEAALLALEQRFGLDDPTDGAAAMALNGGVAYSGGTCGAITGAALALGRLAHGRIGDRTRAKRVARELTAALIDEFRAEFEATDCRTLIGVDLRAPGAHAAFIAGGAWRVTCLRRLEVTVERLAILAEPAAWDAAVAAVEAANEAGAVDEAVDPAGAAEPPDGGQVGR